MRLPRKKSEALSATSTSKNRSARKPRNNWTRERLDYAALEAAKVFIEAIVFKDIPRFRKEVRVSILPWSTGTAESEVTRRRGYLDVRVYINGRSTGQGVLLHLDHFKTFVAGVLAADHQVARWIEQGVIDPHP